MIGTLILLRKNRIKNIMVNIGTIEGVAVAEVGVAVEAETTKGVEVTEVVAMVIAEVTVVVVKVAAVVAAIAVHIAATATVVLRTAMVVSKIANSVQATITADREVRVVVVPQIEVNPTDSGKMATKKLDLRNNTWISRICRTCIFHHCCQLSKDKNL